MSATEVIKESPMSLAEVKSELEKIQKRDGELTFRGNKTLEYVQQLNVLGPKKAKELQSKIEAIDIPRLKEIHIAKILDVLPKSLEEVKLTLAGYTVQVKDEHAKKIAEAVKEFC